MSNSLFEFNPEISFIVLNLIALELKIIRAKFALLKSDSSELIILDSSGCSLLLQRKKQEALNPQACVDPIYLSK